MTDRDIVEKGKLLEELNRMNHLIKEAIDGIKTNDAKRVKLNCVVIGIRTARIVQLVKSVYTDNTLSNF